MLDDGLDDGLGFRVYDPAVDEFDSNGYPYAWRYLKHLVREHGEYRCARCHHPYRSGEHGDGEWSACDQDRCTHPGPIRYRFTGAGDKWVYDGLIAHYGWVDVPDCAPTRFRLKGAEVEARWRILTVHHLDGNKANCRWFNLVPLCQRCHLTIQGKVVMDRPYDKPHTAWFRPYAAAFYAAKYHGEDLSREEVNRRMDDLLGLELRQNPLFPGVES